MTTFNKIRLLLWIFYPTLLFGLLLYDEAPLPERVELMTAPRPEVLSDDNLWLAMLGFAAPEGETSVAYGKRYLGIIDEAFNRGDFQAAWNAIFNDPPTIKLQADLPSKIYKLGFLECVVEHPEEVSLWLRENAELVRRYRELRSYSCFVEPLDFGAYMPFPGFSQLRNGQVGIFFETALKADRGDIAGAFSEVEKDVEFWRFVLRNSETFITRLIAIACMTRDLEFVSDLGAKYPLDTESEVTQEKILRSFAAEELSFEKVIIGEIRYLLANFEIQDKVFPKGWSWDALLYKSDATLNQVVRINENRLYLASLSPRQFAQTLRVTPDCYENNWRMGLSFLYNPTGEILAVMASSISFSNFMESGHELEGIRRIAWLKILASREEVPPQEMPQFLQEHAAELGNPYTGKAMNWDAEQNRIFFPKLNGEGDRGMTLSFSSAERVVNLPSRCAHTEGPLE
ncbi:MAG: hypothetical protein C0622_12975 [Desulfuromonas sp.]|nr:MAG: hypothetical protein C0622_12975 [Desulfuromonas sp.]